mmetsp:Transcript_33468/g.101107  ORF Transcript_33468/g.101107 Transcript_33468/m.101107 type:complete len:203 (+) Transcript_33468:1309-1917(+)
MVVRELISGIFPGHVNQEQGSTGVVLHIFGHVVRMAVDRNPEVFLTVVPPQLCHRHLPHRRPGLLSCRLEAPRHEHGATLLAEDLVGVRVHGEHPPWGGHTLDQTAEEEDGAEKGEGKCDRGSSRSPLPWHHCHRDRWENHRDRVGHYTLKTSLASWQDSHDEKGLVGSAVRQGGLEGSGAGVEEGGTGPGWGREPGRISLR